MILSDRSINEAIASGRLGIEPFDPKLVQPSSVDVRLDNKFLVFRNTKRAYIDVKQPADDLMEMIEVGTDEPMFLHPHEFVLGSTIERVRMPDDLVGRLEGRSSLGRLGVVIHSSLPYDSPVLFLDEAGVLEFRPIGELVEQRLRGRVVAFDRDTFEVGFHKVTNWFAELPDRIYEVRLASGRRVHVTAGHNLFTLNAAGDLVKTPTRALVPGTRVAVPKWIPDPGDQPPYYRLIDLLPRSIQADLLCQGPTVERALQERAADVRQLLRDAGLSVSYYLRFRKLPLRTLEQLHRNLPDAGLSVSYYFRLGKLPLRTLEQLDRNLPAFEADDRFSFTRGSKSLPAVIQIDHELAWLLGLYVAKGYRRQGQVSIANTDPTILDRAEAVFNTLGQRVHRGKGAITCCSVLVSAMFAGLEMGTGASSKRLPKGALGWPWELLEALLSGLIDGDGSIRPERECLWTTSTELVSQTLVLAARLGKRAVTQVRAARPRGLPVHVVSIAANRHKAMTSVPNPTSLLTNIRFEMGFSWTEASRLCGFQTSTVLHNVATDRNRDAGVGGAASDAMSDAVSCAASDAASGGMDAAARAVHVATPERSDAADGRAAPSIFSPLQKLTRPANDSQKLTSMVNPFQKLTRLVNDPQKLTRLVNGALQWDEVVDVVDTGRFETVYDLEVRSSGGRVENFLAGHGGVLVANTAGFIDAAFEGHVTLEISNLANLPIALYPGMRIGQISFSLMTTPADKPYGAARGSKYSGQQLPTASRLYLDFQQ